MARAPGVKPAQRLPCRNKGQRQHQVGHEDTLARPEDKRRRHGEDRHRQQPGHGDRRRVQRRGAVGAEAAAAIDNPRGQRPFQREQRGQPGEQREHAQIGHADAGETEQGQREIDIERTDVILHHQREGAGADDEAGAAERGHRGAGEQFHGVDAGFPRLIIVETGQTELV
jgi:hypothetical protein